MNKNDYGIFDYLKFFLALLVVEIHIPIAEGTQIRFWFYTMIETMCVPIFFGISGLLFAKGHKIQIENSDGTCFGKAVKRLLLLWLPWSLFSEIFYYILRRLSFNNKPSSLECELKDYIYKLLFWDMQYWYIQKVILSIMILYIFYLINLYFIKVKLQKIIELLVFVTIAITLFDRFVYSFGVTGLKYCVYYMEGFVLGMYFQEKSVNGKRIISGLLTLIIAFGCSLIENRLLESSFATVSSLIIVPLVLTICLMLKNIRGGWKPNLVLRKLSTWIYMSHLIIISITQSLFKYVLKINDDGYVFFLNYFVVLTISLCSGLGVLYLQKRPFLKWTKYII